MGMKNLRNKIIKIDSGGGGGGCKYSCPGSGEECIEA